MDLEVQYASAFAISLLRLNFIEVEVKTFDLNTSQIWLSVGQAFKKFCCHIEMSPTYLPQNFVKSS